MVNSYFTLSDKPVMGPAYLSPWPEGINFFKGCGLIIHLLPDLSLSNAIICSGQTDEYARANSVYHVNLYNDFIVQKKKAEQIIHIPF